MEALLLSERDQRAYDSRTLASAPKARNSNVRWYSHAAQQQSVSETRIRSIAIPRAGEIERGNFDL